MIPDSLDVRLPHLSASSFLHTGTARRAGQAGAHPPPE
jgi:hypothetical protein